MAGKKKSPVAHDSDGGTQIVLTIPYKVVEAKKKARVAEMAKDIIVPGFRKGKAPTEKAQEKIDHEILMEKVLSELLPKYFGEAVTANKLTPITYPKFELIKADDGADWQVRAKFAEMPKIDLGDYKKKIKNQFAKDKIWTPDKKGKQEPKPEEREHQIVEFMIKTIKFDVPKLMIEDEVSVRLSSLLERLEKLGLTLENYLASIKSDPDKMRAQYDEQARKTLKLEFILAKIAEAESISASEADIEAFVEASKGDEKTNISLQNPDQKRTIASMLTKRKTLDFLISLA